MAMLSKLATTPGTTTRFDSQTAAAHRGKQEKQMSYAQLPKNFDAIALGMGPLTDAAADKSSVQREMPRYECHKQVWALRIAKLELDLTLAAEEDRETTGGAWITPYEEGCVKFHIDAEYVRKHRPHEGGYYVVYADGYKSFSPSAAFEQGYTRI
jgi:hypothetical protein